MKDEMLNGTNNAKLTTILRIVTQLIKQGLRFDAKCDDTWDYKKGEKR